MGRAFGRDGDVFFFSSRRRHTRFKCDWSSDVCSSDLPQAVLAYTNTYDHRRVVEICARYGVHVMMEKPLAVSLEDARAIEEAARGGKIQVLVNYETTWDRSNQAAYDLVHANAIGAVRKVVGHDR